MKKIIRIFLKNVIYLLVGWLTGMVLGNFPWLFAIAFFFLFMIGEFAAHLITSTGLKLRGIDWLRYLLTVILFVGVFRPMYNYMAKIAVIDNLQEAEGIAASYFSPNYVKIKEPYVMIENESVEIVNNCTVHDIKSTVTNKKAEHITMKWCSLSMDDFYANDEPKSYPSNKWFTPVYRLKKGVLGVLYLELTPTHINPQEKGNSYFYIFIGGLMLINIIIFFSTNEED